MTPQEKALYHQIHPLKLFTDVAAEIISLYLFWKRKLFVGLIVEFLPPILASLSIMRWVNLVPYKQSAFGSYLQTYMTPAMVAMRVMGTIVTHIGAWYRRPYLIPLGLGLVIFGWLRGLLWTK
jgi:hypothetical protein